MLLSTESLFCSGDVLECLRAANLNIWENTDSFYSIFVYVYIGVCMCVCYKANQVNSLTIGQGFPQTIIENLL